MSSHNFSPVPGPADVPPTQPGPIVAREVPSNWPSVLGVIAIVFGALGTLGGIWGALSPLFIDWMADRMPANQAAAMEAAGEQMTWTVVLSLAFTALAIGLLIAGIGLLRRRRWAIGASQIWAILKILVVIASTALQYQMAEVQTELVTQQGGTAGIPAQFAGTLTTAAMVVGLLWGCALPVFMLIWFARGKIKSETAGWS